MNVYNSKKSHREYIYGKRKGKGKGKEREKDGEGGKVGRKERSVGTFDQSILNIHDYDIKMV